MTKRSADELHRDAAKAHVKILRLKKMIKQEKKRAYEIECELGYHLVEFQQTDPETLERVTFFVTKDMHDRLAAQGRKLGDGAWVMDLFDFAVEGIDRSDAVADRIGYVAAVDAEVKDIRKKWSRYLRSKMLQVELPGDCVLYFADMDVVREFTAKYQVIVDEQWRAAGREPRPVPPSAFNIVEKPLKRTGITTNYTGLYTPGLEHDLRKDIEKDARKYVARVIEQESKK
jgi:hypothetical protein